MKKPSKRQRWRNGVSVIRLIIQGYYAIQVAELLNMHQRPFQAMLKSLIMVEWTLSFIAIIHPANLLFCHLTKNRKEVRRILEHSSPTEEGYGCEFCWDTKILKHMLEEKFEIIMSRNGIKDMLKCWGFSHAHPTYTLKRSNRQKQEAFQLCLIVLFLLLLCYY
jgi:hypothetical protein